MEIKYRLTEDDYLTQHMFLTGTSKFLRKKRMRIQFIGSAVNFVLAIILFLLQITFFGWFLLGWFFMVFGAMWLLLYTNVTRRRYKKDFFTQFREGSVSKLDEEYTLVTKDDEYEIIESKGQGQFKYSTIISVFELKDHFLLGFESGSPFILPKGRTKGDELGAVVKTIADHAKVEIIDACNWKWK